VVLAVALGGAIGGSARYGVGRLLEVNLGAWPWATLAVNVLGCFAAGLLVAGVVEHPSAHALARPFLVTGFLGGFTTMSALAVETRAIAVDGAGPVVAVAYVAASLAAGLVAVRLGRTAAARGTAS
jgi:CrcB protein